MKVIVYPSDQTGHETIRGPATCDRPGPVTSPARRTDVLKSIEERFWAKVEKTTTCWLWTGTHTGKGYGRFWPTNVPTLAHRWAWEQENGAIPDGLTIDHLCHDGAQCQGGRDCPHRRCVRPSHLAPLEAAANLRRAFAERRSVQTHCRLGHEWTEANTIPIVRGRLCRTCREATNRRYFLSHQEAINRRIRDHYHANLARERQRSLARYYRSKANR